VWASRRRAGAAALIAGGAAWVVTWFLQGAAGEGDAVLGLDEDGWRAALLPALVLLPFGVWVFYVRLGSRAAGLGLAAVAVAELGLLTMLTGSALQAAGVDEGWGVFLVGGLLALVGLLTLGFAVTRSGVLPRESGTTFAGGLASFAAGVLVLPLFGLGFLLWGYVLLGGTREERQ